MIADRSGDGLSKADDSVREKTKKFPWSLEIALSGGGHRATAYTLGALLYLVHADLNGKVRNIASVSGASITNAFVASRCDFQIVTIGDFKDIAADLIARLERRGLLSCWTTWVCVALVVALIVASSFLFKWIWWNFFSSSPFFDVAGAFFIFLIVLQLARHLGDGLSWAARGLLMIASSCLLGWIWWSFFSSSPLFDVAGVFLIFLIAVSIGLAFRGWIIDRWMAAVYFGPSGIERKLQDISGRPVDHVFCATDLHFGAPFFFSSFFGGRQVSEWYGRADAADVPLQTVVRASSAFPPAIPPILHEPDHQFLQKNDANGKYEYEPGPPYIWLTDGGAYNNFATEWHAMRMRVFVFDSQYAKKKYSDHPEAERRIRLVSRLGYGDIQLIVDASQPERWKHIPAIDFPMGQLLKYVFRTMSILYGSTLAGRSREAHVATLARMRRSPARWFAGNLVDEKQSPKKRAREYQEEGALQIYIPYGERLDTIYQSWKKRPRVTSASRRRWDAHPHEREAGLRALGKDLVRDQLEFVKTTFRTLRKGEALRLVVAGYLNTREGIYGPFDYRPEAIPPKEWFEDLSTLAGDRLRRSFWKRLHAAKSIIFKARA